MRSTVTFAWALGLAALPCTTVILADTPDLPTIDGPEVEALVKELKGQLVYPKPVGGILATLLPSLEERTVRPAGKEPAVINLSGPDRDGRVAVVESGPGKEVVLRLVRPNASEGKEILRRPDSGFRSKAIGRPALSPVGAFVAFVAKMQDLRMPVEPKITFQEGMLEVWQADERRRLEFEAKAIDRSLAWLPDGRRLLFSALVGPDTVPQNLIDDYSRATGSGVIPLVEMKTPVVHRIELSGGKALPLCLGRRSIVSTDGKVMLVEGIGFEWMLYDFSNRGLRLIKLPGLYDKDRLGVYEGGAIALLGGDLAIYWGLPTTGSVQKTTKRNSPLVGAKKMPSIKAARLTTGEFQTIIPFMDPRHEVLFGEVKESK